MENDKCRPESQRQASAAAGRRALRHCPHQGLRHEKSNHYFAHTSPTFGRAADMLTFFGCSFKGVGENIAHYATLEKAQAGFMSSSSHRANMLGSQWTRVGVGVCVDDNGFVYVTQLFAR